MVARQKDVKSFFNKLKKRCPNSPIVLSKDRKVLEHVVFAIFLENATFEQARNSFVALQSYFIDWNEIRIAKAEEIARVVNGKADELARVANIGQEATRVGERLRRTLQWIFDKTYKFELEDQRANGYEEVVDFLRSIPYCTRFMAEYVSLFVFGRPIVPLDESSLRVLRLLGAVSVKDDTEVVVELEDSLKEADARDCFFALHEFSREFCEEATSADAMKFLTSFDSAVAKRSVEPLVDSKVSNDPLEIARDLSRKERSAKAFTPMSDAGFEDDDERADDFSEGAFDADREDGGIESSVGARVNNASVEASLTRDKVTYVSSEHKKSSEKSDKPRRAAKKASEESSERPAETKKKREKNVKNSTPLIDAVEEASNEVAVKAEEIASARKASKGGRVSKVDALNLRAESAKTVDEVVFSKEETKPEKPVRKRQKAVQADDKKAIESTDESSENVKPTKNETVSKTSRAKAVTKKVVTSEESETVEDKKSPKKKDVKSKETKTSAKSGVKAATGGRRASSEPPDSANEGVGKTTKRSPKSSKNK